jgi:hypothetical protein
MRQAVTALAALLLAACATTSGAGAREAWDTTPILGPLQAALLYHAESATPPPPALALAWPELCQERGAEKQAAAVRAAAGRLAEEAARVKRAPLWRVQIRETLGPYDRTAGGFRTSLKPGSVIRFDSFNYCFKELRYLVVFRNGDEHGLVRLDEEAARAMLRRDPDREVRLDLLVEPVGSQLDHGAGAVVLDILRLRAVDATSTVLLDTASPPGR